MTEEQRMEHLAQANRVRIRRAKALTKVRAGTLAPDKILAHPDLQGIVVERLLRNVPLTVEPISRQALRPYYNGGSRRERIRRIARIEGNTRLEFLSTRQRDILLAELKDLPLFR